jgi:hypothetical protein
MQRKTVLIFLHVSLRNGFHSSFLPSGALVLEVFQFSAGQLSFIRLTGFSVIAFSGDKVVLLFRWFRYLYGLLRASSGVNDIISIKLTHSEYHGRLITLIIMVSPHWTS